MKGEEMGEYSFVGKRIPRLDGALKATGKAEFAGDIVLPGMLYGKILRSPYPHARILNIDVSKAQNIPGVKAIITGKDTLRMKFTQIDVPGYEPDEYPLASDKVRYIGDEVAAVAATDEDTAEEALELIRVDYEELPAVFDPEEAMKPGAPQIHDNVEHNICARTLLEAGDVEEGFKESDHVREDRFKTGVAAHCQMEPNAVLASFDPSGRLTIWPTCMGIHGRRGLLARIFNMAESEIRVINPYIGGGYGGKFALLAMDICSIILSRMTGRPVKIVNTREEQFTCTRRDYSISIRLKTGVKKDGTLVAQDYKAITNKGAYRSIGPLSTFLVVAYMNGTYRIPNIRYEGLCVYTNTPTSGPKRSHQNPIVRFSLESQLEMIADELGMDPMELRLKNAVQTGDVLPATGKLISCGLKKCIQESAKALNWKERRGNLPANRGMGMGCTYFFGGGAQMPPPHMTSSAAFAKCNEDGTVNILVGTVDTGTGCGTMFAQIAAEELGIDVRNVNITLADTDTTPPDLSSHLSAVAHITGNAVRLACKDLKQQIFKVAAERLEADVSDLEAKDGRVYVKGSPEKGMSFSDAVSVSVRSEEGNPILGKGYYSPGVTFGDFATGRGPWSPTYIFANAVAEVEVDRETGKVKLVRIGVAQDCGYAINPMEVEGQLHGSSSMAQGNALWEELIFENGQALTPRFLDYKLPVSVDIPEIIAIPVNSIDPKGPFGAKEAGEGSTATTVPAIANAIHNAIGVRVKEIPMTPEKIIQSIA